MHRSPTLQHMLLTRGFAHKRFITVQTLKMFTLIEPLAHVVLELFHIGLQVHEAAGRTVLGETLHKVRVHDAGSGQQSNNTRKRKQKRGEQDTREGKTG